MFGGYCYFTDRQSQVLESGNWPRDPRAGVSFLGEGRWTVGEGWLLAQLGMDSDVPMLVLSC